MAQTCGAVVMVDFIFHTSFCIKFDPGFKRKMNGNLKLQGENSIKAVEEYMVPSVRSVALFFDEKLHTLHNINFLFRLNQGKSLLNMKQTVVPSQ